MVEKKFKNLFLDSVSSSVAADVVSNSSLVGNVSLDSLASYSVGNMCYDGLGPVGKEVLLDFENSGGVVLDFENSSVHLPSGKQVGGVSYFGSGFGQGRVILDFQKSEFRLPSAKDGLRKPAMFNDENWFPKGASTKFLRDDRFDHIFRQSGSVETQGSCSSEPFGRDRGRGQFGHFLQEDVKTRDVRFNTLSPEGAMSQYRVRRNTDLNIVVGKKSRAEAANSFEDMQLAK
ncbi:hypothetical protein Tco_0228010 [Tanacetum coccineum]